MCVFVFFTVVFNVLFVALKFGFSVRQFKDREADGLCVCASLCCCERKVQRGSRSFLSEIQMKSSKVLGINEKTLREKQKHTEHIADCVSLQSRPLCRKETLCIMDDVTSCRFSNLGILHVTKKGVVEVLTRRLREEKKRLKGPHCHLTGRLT